MNAVDRFSNTLARYRQMPQSLPVYAAPAYPQPQPRSDLDRTLDKVGQGAAVLSRLAALVQRVQNPALAVNSPQTLTYPGTSPYAPAHGRLGQSLERLGQAVGDKGVDTFVRQAAPVIDEAIPLLEDIVNLASGKPRPQSQATQQYPYQPYGSQSPMIADQVAPMVDGVSALVSGVNSLVKAFEGLFKH